MKDTTRFYPLWGVVLVFTLSIVLFYIGYCWGWWGQENLSLQYLFQCTCPRVSEPARYPEQMEVMFSACDKAAVRISPSGLMLAVKKRVGWSQSSYILNLQTGERTPFYWPDTSFTFLTDEIIYVRKGRGYLLDIRTGIQYPVEYRRDIYQDNGEENPILLTSLREAEQVFLTFGGEIVVTLNSEFEKHPERNFTIWYFEIQGRGGGRLEQFLEENSIPYIRIPHPSYPGELTSPDGIFVARQDGIYLAGTEQKIVDGFLERKYKPRGWIFDSSGVILLASPNYLIESTSALFYPDMIPVSQPVLKLKVPVEYWIVDTESGE